jgi:hypothetical protein
MKRKDAHPRRRRKGTLKGTDTKAKRRRRRESRGAAVGAPVGVTRVEVKEIVPLTKKSKF